MVVFSLYVCLGDLEVMFDHIEGVVTDDVANGHV